MNTINFIEKEIVFLKEAFKMLSQIEHYTGLSTALADENERRMTENERQNILNGLEDKITNSKSIPELNKEQLELANDLSDYIYEIVTENDAMNLYSEDSNLSKEEKNEVLKLITSYPHIDGVE